MRRLIPLVLLLGLFACERKSETPSARVEPSATASTTTTTPTVKLPDVADRRQAKDFAGATAWVNVDRPLVAQDLAGRVVVVDFWTSCCINCIHTLPILSALEKRHANDAVLVVGVHSPKFDAETETERLRAAIAENDVRHPVAVDGSMKIWKAWSASSWPTIEVVDAKGRIVYGVTGEPDPDRLEAYVQAALAEGAKENALTKEKLTALKPEAPDTGPLAFPGKLLALKDGGWAVSDTGHHRVVFFDASFAVKDVVGTGLAGFTEGTYGEASFKKPQGLAEAGDVVYVADTENHAVRAIDRKKKTVATIAGTGSIGHARLREKSPAKTTELRSPWDLAVPNGSGPIYVALAGSHQIAILDPKESTIAPFAGDGRELRVDDIGDSASFAQPSGLATDGKTLWVADSETSSIRAVSLSSKKVTTLVGKDLFVFGDVDGAAEKVRLEHPLGVAWGAAPKASTPALFVADTYNSKVKRLDLATGSTRTLAGARTHADLFEPSGLVVKDGAIVAVDTKHHRLVRLEVNADGDAKIEPIAIKGLTAPAGGIAVAGAEKPPPPSETIDAPSVQVRASGTTVKVVWDAPAGTGVNEEAPFKLRWNRSEGLAEAPPEQKATGAKVKDGFTIPIKPIAGTTHATLDGEIDLVVCDVVTHKICVPLRRGLALGFVVTKDAPAEQPLRVKLPEAKAP
jgi:thiol-disulfide isomerase/thioredoxin